MFILCGAKFYLDYILPSNPSSKNPVFKLIWGGAKIRQNWEFRLFLAFLYGAIHLVGLVMYFRIDAPLWINALINIYPVIIQIYIGLRCWRAAVAGGRT